MNTVRVGGGPSVGELIALPDLVALPDGQKPTRWHREPDGTVVLFVAHSAVCAACVAYMEQLAAVKEELEWWGGHSYVLLPRPDTAGRSLATRLPLRFVADLPAVTRSRWRLTPGDAALIVADRWGQVFFTVDTGDGHDLPDPAKVTSLVTGIGIQCPECGVLDVPLVRDRW